MPGGLLQPAYPLHEGELARLLSALAAARKCGADAGAFSELPAEAQALLLRLDIKPRVIAVGVDMAGEGLSDQSATVVIAGDGDGGGFRVVGVPTTPTVDPNRPRSAASF